jgi:hypothetical protein
MVDKRMKRNFAGNKLREGKKKDTRVVANEGVGDEKTE